jgi:hypothetical protein
MGMGRISSVCEVRKQESGAYAGESNMGGGECVRVIGRLDTKCTNGQAARRVSYSLVGRSGGIYQRAKGQGARFIGGEGLSSGGSFSRISEREVHATRL